MELELVDGSNACNASDHPSSKSHQLVLIIYYVELVAESASFLV